MLQDIPGRCDEGFLPKKMVDFDKNPFGETETVNEITGIIIISQGRENHTPNGGFF